MLFKRRSPVQESSVHEKPVSARLDDFLNRMVGVQAEIRNRISARLRELEFNDVGEMGRKSLQFYQREISKEAAAVIGSILATQYRIQLKDLRSMTRTPGSPEAIDENYRVPSFY